MKAKISTFLFLSILVFSFSGGAAQKENKASAGSEWVIGVVEPLEPVIADILRHHRDIPPVVLIAQPKFTPQEAGKYDLIFSDDEELSGRILSRNIPVLENRLWIEDRLVLVGAEKFSQAGWKNVQDALRVANLIAVIDPGQYEQGRKSIGALKKMKLFDSLSGKILPVATPSGLVDLIKLERVDCAIALQSYLTRFEEKKVLGVFPPAVAPPVRYHLFQLTHEGREGYAFFTSARVQNFLKKRGFDKGDF